MNFKHKLYIIFMELNIILWDFIMDTQNSLLPNDCIFGFDNIIIAEDNGIPLRGEGGRAHVHSYWEIKIFPEKAKGPADAFVIITPPGIVHFETQPEYWQTGSAIAFKPPYIIFQLGGSPRQEILYPFNQADKLCPGGIFAVINTIVSLKQSPDDSGKKFVPLINTMLRMLLEAVTLSRQGSDREIRNSGYSITLAARNYIERNYYRSDLTVEHIAAYAGVTPGHLANLFQREKLGTIRQYLVNCRLQNAAALLKTGRYTVKDCATITGWNNQFYFSNCFAKVFGMRPSDIPVAPETSYKPIKPY